MSDIILRGGMLYDGSGDDPRQADLAITGDRIEAIADAGTLKGKQIVDVTGLAVAPGFINMLSWAVESLIEDGDSQSDIRQGVTLEVMGEGTSMGPLSSAMKENPVLILGNSHIKYDIEWTTLGEYLEFLERKGVSTNVASFVGSSTIRAHVVGLDDRPATDAELMAMQQLVAEAMQEGAMGMSAALIYPPATYASTEELVALAKTVAEHNGMYISHIRNEGSAIMTALEEFISIVRESGVRGEIYHLKLAGRTNWDKLPQVLDRLEQAHQEGLPITVDMYPYDASGTGLASCLPPWAHEGGLSALLDRLRDPDTRTRIKSEMLEQSQDWENMFYENLPENILLAGFQNPDLQSLTGKRLSEISAIRGTDPADTVLDLLLEDESRIFTIYFSMREDNLRRQVQLPYLSFCSDAGSIRPESPFTLTHVHPRAYGSFARVLGKYCRDEGLITLQETIRRLTSLPAHNLRLQKRGTLKAGYFADVVVFDPDTIQDHATFENPHQFSTGMHHVFVNGGHVLRDGQHTGVHSGQVVRGAGWRGM